MTSGYIPASGEPGPDEILAALRKAVREDPGLRERQAEDVSHELASRGYLEREPSPHPRRGDARNARTRRGVGPPAAIVPMSGRSG